MESQSETTQTVSILKLPVLKTGDVSAASFKDQASTASYVDDVMFSFFSYQSNAPPLDNEDLEQIDADDLEETDLKWQVAMLTMRVKRFIKKKGRKLDLNDKETVSFDMTKVECYNCHRRGHFARECRAPRNQGNKNRYDPRRNAPVDTSTTNALVVQDGIGGHDWSFQAEDGITNFALMAYTSQGSSSLDSEVHTCSKDCLKSYEALQKYVKDKTGLGYDSQMNESELNNIHMNESEVVHSVFNSKESDVDDSPVNDRFKTTEGFHAVPPPYTGNYMPPKPDLSFYRLDESVFKSAVRKTTTSVPETETSISKTSKDIVEKPKTVRPSAPIIKEWDTNSDNDTSASISTGRPVNIAAPKLKVNDALPITYYYFKAHSPAKAVVSAAEGNGENVVKRESIQTISQPLQMLHMDLFGPTSVRIINHKTYCLVVTDDFSRFSWVFFLATKDETSGILQTFITGIENQINHTVKIIRCDNGTEFNNNDMNQFYGMKWIKREFNVSRTPQKNRVAERKNKTLIEAVRTTLADSLLPTTFWAKAVNTACYVQNRVLVTKPHNKTPYELLHGRPPSISFMRPFGCLVTIFNALYPLGKFDGKVDEGFLVGYSINSKAFRVFNTRTRKVEENLHINFLENKPNVTGSGPEWLFDIDSLTKSMNYEPVTTGNQTNGDAGIETNVNAGQAGQEKASDHEYILLPLMLSNSPLSSSTQSTDDKDADEVPDKGDDDKEGYVNSTNRDSTTSPSVSTAGLSINTASENINTSSPNINTTSPIPNDSSMQSLENTGIFDDAYDDREVGAEADLNNLETTMNLHQKAEENKSQRLSKLPICLFSLTNRTQEGYTQEEGIDYDEVFAPVARIEAIMLFLAYASFMGFIVYLMDVKSAFLYGTIKEEVYVYQPPGFEDPQFPDKKMDTEEALLIKLCSSRRIEMMHKRFQMSSIGELTFFLGLQVQQKEDRYFISQDKYVADILKKFDFVTLKTASTPMEPKKTLVKNEEADNVDVHL
ncbi:putative ribonuclease H-like domain-containing protein [Tanacetum coccineum]